jgi:hypothetical protein
LTAPLGFSLAGLGEERRLQDFCCRYILSSFIIDRTRRPVTLLTPTFAAACEAAYRDQRPPASAKLDGSGMTITDPSYGNLQRHRWAASAGG